MTVVIVQCRLSSTRLPRKALKDLGGRPVLTWVLNAMHQIPADAYYVATDTESFSELEPVVRSCGWECFAGPKDDVLERFCMLINEIHADVVVRATADNPFLFYEAAQALLEEYTSCSRYSECDYITWTGLPHGSGIEIFNAQSLLKAKELTDLPYDHEHVGPALYNHRERFSALMLPSPRRWNFPSYRTTIDTPADYIRALTIVQTVSAGKAGDKPYTTEQIVAAFKNPAVSHPVLCVPSTKKGRGTGHLRRCLDIAKSEGASVYIPADADLAETDKLVAQYVASGMHPWQITSAFPLPNEYSLIFTDIFSLDDDMARKLYAAGSVASLDEGSRNTFCCDYILDVIPSAQESRISNMSEPGFMDMPANRRPGGHLKSADEFKTVLVSAGGEDPADLVIPAAEVFAKLGKNVTAIRPRADMEQDRIPKELAGKIKLIAPVPDLREQLALYDLVVTHYGLTAYEAAAAGCAVLLLGTTPLHEELAAKYGFMCVSGGRLSVSAAAAFLKNPEQLYVEKIAETVKPHAALSTFVRRLSFGRRFPCPVCGMQTTPYDPVEARTSKHTFRRCASCGTLYMSWTMDETDTSYSKSYFFDQYKQQYGKTYLDDFTAIKAQCVRRTSLIDLMYHRKLRSSVTPAILDIGCAYGPFLAASADSGWQVFGTDISLDAVKYVRNTLLFPAACAAFPDFDPVSEFGIKTFDAVTMWYVIEHFKDLDAALKAVSNMVKPGGIFAFSTPSASGVSERFNREQFFEQSPSDHYTLWEPAHVQSVLARYGFRVVKIVITGHHPERFPFIKRYGWQKKSLPFTLAAAASHLFHLGDTFEVYCKKTVN